MDVGFRRLIEIYFCGPATPPLRKGSECRIPARLFLLDSRYVVIAMCPIRSTARNAGILSGYPDGLLSGI